MFNRAVSAFRKGIVARKAAQVENSDHDHDGNDDMGADDTSGVQSAAPSSPSALVSLVDGKGNVSVTAASAAA